jgi:hypothetical protein
MLYYFNDDDIDDIELDLDIDDDFDLDLEIDDLDLDDEISSKSSKDSESDIKVDILSEKIPQDVHDLLSERFIDLINTYLNENQKMADVKNDFANEWNSFFDKFVLLEFPWKNNLNKITLYRYKIPDIRLFNDKQKAILDTLKLDIAKFEENEPVPAYYADEWLRFVNNDLITSSSGDDVSTMKKPKSPGVLKARLNKDIEITRKNVDSMIKMRNESIDEFKIECDKIISNRGDNPVNLTSVVKKIASISAAIDNLGGRIRTVNDKLRQLTLESSKILEDEDKTDDPGVVLAEHGAISEMAKICTGPRGNRFPFLTGDFFPPFINDRNSVIEKIKEIRDLLPGIFYRKFLGIETEKCPFVAIVPCYGNTGFCWDPIDPANKESGRGKIAVPLYSQKKLDDIISEALGDYFWNKNKTAAGSRWLEEGITGKYYMYHQDLKIQKKKGKDVQVIPDLKESFLFHFKQWVLEERIGRNKLPKEVRQMFWINIPFDIKTKEDLSQKGFAYKTLWENDQRRGA